jgi:hypothetical protein
VQFDKRIVEADAASKVLKEELEKMVAKIGNIVDSTYVLENTFSELDYIKQQCLQGG